MDKYIVGLQNESQRKVESEIAFSLFRNELNLLNKNNKSQQSVALGGLADDGRWSVYFENELWVVCVGERGHGYNPSFFFSIWDALNYLGYSLGGAMYRKISAAI
ncbi:hypothetical protein [Hydrogenophaga sp. NFH-34]|uniref:hypothetical protein n=1 Tax=Hydrogenophaga sp. NFH-34 TaxID=2744446 RepID=UPI001F42AD65|nr:hypothetical protein [Hydrogenophaga sp. NFH-34]